MNELKKNRREFLATMGAAGAGSILAGSGGSLAAEGKQKLAIDGGTPVRKTALRYRPYGPDEITLVEDVYQVDENLDGQPDFTFGNPDFSFVQFRSNLVVRWEYIPGSELFLVWSQDITTSGDPSLDLLPNLESNIFGNGLASNIFLLKATYRFAF